MDLRRLTGKAKELIEKRGGTEALKEDAAELKEIATGPGKTTNKAKAAFEAVKDPGAEAAAGTEEAPGDEPSPPGHAGESPPRGKEAGGGARKRPRGGGGRRRGGRSGN